MAIQIEKSFSVRAPASSVWAFLTDLDQVASCLPGAAITGQTDDQAYTGTIKVKVGPVASSYKGEVRFEELDEEGGMARLSATGQEARGKGGARMTMTSRIEEREGATEVNVTSDVAVTGILAQMGRGMIVDVSDQMFQVFTGCMSRKLEAAAGDASAVPRNAAPAIDAVALGRTAGKKALARTIRRPVFWIILAAILVIVVQLLR